MVAAGNGCDALLGQGRQDAVEAPTAGQDGVRGDVEQGLEGEPALDEARVRDGEVGQVDRLLAPQQDVEVERPRPPADEALAAVPQLDRLQLAAAAPAAASSTSSSTAALW